MDIAGKCVVWDQHDKGQEEGVVLAEQRREGRKEGRKKGKRGSGNDCEKQQSCFWFGFSVSCHASQATDPMCKADYLLLSRVVLSAWWTGLMSVPALSYPFTLGRPFLSIQSFPSPPDQPLANRSKSSKIGPHWPSTELLSGRLPPQCMLTPRPLPVWGHQLSGNIHHTGDRVLLRTGNWVGAFMRTHAVPSACITSYKVYKSGWHECVLNSLLSLLVYLFYAQLSLWIKYFTTIVLKCNSQL